MMTHRIITLILVFSLSLLIVQCKNNKKEKQKEPAKTEKGTEAKVEKEKPKLVYDDRGNVIERHVYSYRKADGSLRSRDSYYYSYDTSNNVIEEIKESYFPDGSLDFKNVNYYKYDDRNLKIDLVFESYDRDNVLQRTAHHSYKYNNNGHKTEDIGYRTDNTVKSRIILDPDESGFLQSEEYIHYDEEGNIVDHKKYYYSQYGLEKTVDLMEGGK